MEIKEFYNETFDFALTLIVFDSTKKTDERKLEKILIKANLDYSIIDDSIGYSKGFCVSSSPYYLIIDEGLFEGGKDKNREIITVLQHECNHIREFVLSSIAEKVSKTDSETYLRISDWCFRKCLRAKFFKKIIK